METDERTWVFKLTILYSTLTVCKAGMPNPFNHCTPDHSNQGFSWRDGTVSFYTPDMDEPEAAIHVEMNNVYSPVSQAIRIIKVPFANRSEKVEITSPGNESHFVTMPRGEYALFFAMEEPSITSEQWIFWLTFVSALEPIAAEIVKADADLLLPPQLLMTADPA